MPILLRPTAGPTPTRSSPASAASAPPRLRASEIPATVRELTDAEVVELQVVENLQRSDLLPLEEAEGYAALMKCSHPDGSPYTAEEIAAKIGKSKGYVYARLKLGELCEEGREALAEGRDLRSVAELIARIPGAEQQAKAVEDVSDRGARRCR
jgi:ParB/RepB/Spo0J family partition protein